MRVVEDIYRIQVYIKRKTYCKLKDLVSGKLWEVKLKLLELDKGKLCDNSTLIKLSKYKLTPFGAPTDSPNLIAGHHILGKKILK